MKQRGFTLVELMIVAAIITILSGISVLGYIQYQNKAYDGQAKNLARAIINGAERYYSNNVEYPSATVLLGTAPTNTAPSVGQTSTISSKLNVPLRTLTTGKFSAFPCSGTCTVPQSSGDYVYYLTKGAGSGSAVTYVINGCTFTFPASEINGTSYVIAYKLRETSTWRFHRSTTGEVTTSDTSACPFV
ncbi:type II secretion system protein [Candidatus Saccharibacteria bacterium]|nr:type II secretion system protein [Candidatus Saccharibacteria bacterium]